MKEIIRINLDNEMDLILAHRRAIKLAELCGLALSAQTRFATAVSEIARCSIVNGINSYLILGISYLSGGKKEITAVIYDSIDLVQCNPEAYAYASRLSRDIATQFIDGVYEIILNLRIPYSGIISDSRIVSFKEYFKKEISLSPYEELRKKNIQLIELSEKLSESEAKYRQLTDTLPLIVFSVASSGTVTLANKRAGELLGNFSHFSPVAIGNIFHADDIKVVSKAWETAKKRGSIYTGQARVKVKDTYLWHLISVVPDNDEQGDVSGWIISMVDIHAQKLIEETLKDNKALRQAQESLKSSNDELSRKNRELEQFAYIASHDLQEPLRKIRNFTSLAERTLTEEEKEKLYFNKINASAERMSRLITDVLNYSKLSVKENEFLSVDLNAVMDEVINDFEFQIEEKRADITIGQQLPVVKGIPVQLGQLFYNIIGNSLKFVEGIPVIKISYEFLEKGKGWEPKDTDYHKISVSDNGIGIDSRYISKIFTIFKRLHPQNEYEGTGIGLALCDKIVENHGGIIEINSAPNSGTTIDIFLP
ncbi:ATP-binding protein [Flavobacterium sp. DG1-102-2]|uniref:sensor histidine kinase n=1 Tax=Flavobacterium sp. DG1-102-2 TaxID=3081663 RepID=UPI002948F1D1|nr:ATP-binding protein [Flavobacterium sp. DG1-102-2]MDV6167020.1 ATP-binding protein [Flavobacterium sp. DG1-102-2]